MNRLVKILGVIILLFFLNNCYVRLPQSIPVPPREPVTLDELLAKREESHRPELVIQKGHFAEITSIIFSPDGKLIASSSGDNTTKIWNVETGKELHTLSEYSENVIFSPDGKLLASKSWNTIKLWDIYTGLEVDTFAIPSSYTSYLSRIGFTSDGQFVAVWEDRSQCDQEKCALLITVWDVLKAEILCTFTIPDSMLTSISQDAQFFASLTGDYYQDTQSWDDYNIKIWNLQTGQKMHTFSGKRFSPYTEQGFITNCMAFSSNGKFFANLSENYDDTIKSCEGCTIKLWDLQTGKELHTLSGHTNKVNFLAFSPDGQFFASSDEYYHQKTERWGDSTIRIWNVETGKQLKILHGHSRISSIVFSPDTKLIASGNLDGDITLWEVDTGKKLRTLSGQVQQVTSVSFSPNEQVVASAVKDKGIKLWNLQAGTEPRTFTRDNTEITSVTFSPNGKFLASSDTDLHITLWDIETGKAIQTSTFPQKPSEGITSAAVSPDGQLLATGSDDKTVKVWTSQAQILLHTLSGHTGRVTSVAFSSDGKFLASGSEDSTIKLWDSQMGIILNTFSGHVNGVTSVAFSPNGQFLISGSKDKTLKLWDIQTGQILNTFTGHAAPVRSVDFSPDGKLIVSGGEDNTVRFWRYQTGTEFSVFTGHSGIVTSVMFSPDGNIVASGSEDNTIKRVFQKLCSIQDDVEKSRIKKDKCKNFRSKWPCLPVVPRPQGKPFPFRCSICFSPSQKIDKVRPRWQAVEPTVSASI